RLDGLFAGKEHFGDLPPKPPGSID
ncbi:MAG: hypothetical protein JWP23_1181, partial [Phenylobacterium sp.]|nr:hypothetical protein [Phenylobacterium sp.]